ncbi:RNA-directed DNA polymerase [Arthrobacter subterraneus]|uniref:RNA-directed DNA polymerase n=1 Tax=Arthrobacter subterraneus TaxID=335973 RepID=UPI00381A4AC7
MTEAPGSPRTTVELTDICDPSYLEKIWRKEIVATLRQPRYSAKNYAMDPFLFASYEWKLDSFIESLSRDLRLNQYRPERGEIIRVAKGRGLSRPVCELKPRDALVFRAIVKKIEPDLLLTSRDWVGHAHSDKGSIGSTDAAEMQADSFDWFQFWLRRQGFVGNIIDHRDVKFIVETDIANFYPSIRLEAVREHLLSSTSLSKEVVRVLMQVIDGAVPRSNYSDVSHLGLPQENIGSSRSIAHSLLGPIDIAFDAEGESGKYTRYMDDILVGVKSFQGGISTIARLQMEMEHLGLYPNSSKTKIVSVEQFIVDQMVSTNAVLDRIDNVLSSSLRPGVTPSSDPQVALDELRNISQEHREKHRKIKERPVRWSRVTRRIYTLHRNFGVLDWLDHWAEDLEQDPSGASVYLEYLRSLPLQVSTVESLVRLSELHSDIYTDIGILCAETLSTAPVPRDEDLWRTIASVAEGELSRILQGMSDSGAKDRLASAWFLAATKFSTVGQQTRLCSMIMNSNLAPASPAKLQALAVVRSSADMQPAMAAPRLTIENAFTLDFLAQLRQGDPDAMRVAKKLLKPVKRLSPARYIVLARGLQLLPIVGMNDAEGVARIASTTLAKLEGNPDRLRDYRAEHLFRQWRED